MSAYPMSDPSQEWPDRLRLDTGLELCYLAGDGWKRHCERLEAERLASLDAQGTWHDRLAEALERYWEGGQA